MDLFDVYGDYGFVTEDLLRQFDNLEDAIRYVDNIAAEYDLRGFDRIEVISFAQDGEVIIHHEVRAADLLDDDYYDDSMDGDHDSSMASAGWGTDEDYGYFGDE
jgi:hypothetical protein